MPRPLRIEAQDLWYHVYNRGNEKREVFVSDTDNILFLDTLFMYARQFDVEIHAYVLMGNHFHVLLKTREANLCRFMHDMLTTFVRRYNQLHERVGHVFQGRYKAVVVDQQAYGMELLRYIHLNPARSKRLGNASLLQRLRALRDYPWSSYRAYAGLERCPWPVHTAALLAQFGSTLTEQRARCTRFIKEGLLVENDPFKQLLAKSILGSDTFVDAIKRRVCEGRHDQAAAPARREVTACDLPRVVAAVCEEFYTRPDAIITAHPKHAWRDARRVLLWAAARYCTGKFTLEEIGRTFGGVSSAAVGHARASIDHAITHGLPVSAHALAVARRLSPHEDPSNADHEWNKMYQRLAAFYAQYHHVHIVRGSIPDTRLAAWVERQRLLRKGLAANAQPLTDAQIELLDKLGFVW